MSARKKNGFTLVELMVVVTIIAILTIIGITVFTSVQKNARDARRKADINSIANAMEANYDKTANPVVYAGLSATFFSNVKVPQDPINSTTNRVCNSQPCKYCYHEADTDSTAVAAGLCLSTGDPPIYPSISELGYSSGSGGGPAGGVTKPYWVVCANLEGTETYYCRKNIQ